MENQNYIPQQNGDVSLEIQNKGTDFIDKFIADGHKNEAGFNSINCPLITKDDAPAYYSSSVALTVTN